MIWRLCSGHTKASRIEWTGYFQALGIGLTCERPRCPLLLYHLVEPRESSPWPTSARASAAKTSPGHALWAYLRVRESCICGRIVRGVCNVDKFDGSRCHLLAALPEKRNFFHTAWAPKQHEFNWTTGQTTVIGGGINAPQRALSIKQ